MRVYHNIGVTECEVAMNAYPMVFLIVFVAIIFRLERMAMRFAAEGERTKALVFLWFAGFLILAAATLQLVLNH